MKLDDMRKFAEVAQPWTAEGQRQINGILRALGIDPANMYQELEMSSRYVNTHRDTSYEAVDVSLHSHSYAELIYCCGTSGIEYLLGTDRYRLQTGDIIFVPPGVSHRPLFPERMETPYIRDVIWISPEFMQMVRPFFEEEDVDPRRNFTPLRTVGTPWGFLGELFEQGVREEQERKPGWEGAVIGNTMMLLTHLNRAYKQRNAGQIRAEKPELLDRITAFVEKNYAEHITIDALGKRFYVSGSTISHLFKQKMGISVYRYITQRRLIAAKTLIEQGGQLEHVAMLAGFSDYSSFYRAFKQEYGISPRQYRALQE